MATLINLTDLLVNEINIKYDRQQVEVIYAKIDDFGKKWELGMAIFWVTLPEQIMQEDGTLAPYPENWFQLPEVYFPLLIGLRDDADAALTAKFLV
ncbi:MAG: hypothetical protein JXR36_13475 [Bacteroidales bacterium]|nr:hypothetical protein [Bacteroidales bacterium]